MNILTGLNEEQAAAVIYGDGPLLVVSAAGSGKTKVLTCRAAYLTTEIGIAPERIMLCTFTKKAAQEMQSRVAALVGPLVASQLHIGTMHSLFLKVLRDEGVDFGDGNRNTKFRILEDSEARRMIRDLTPEDEEEDIPSILMKFTLWKNELLLPGAEEIADDKHARLYEQFEDLKNSQALLNFDDMLVQTVLLWERHPEILNRYRHRTPYILVDEAQDTSFVQWRALELLAAPGNNITVVCDHRQAIYSWRGAHPEFILNFQDRFPGATMIGLPRNYRSTPQVVAVANRLISNAKEVTYEDMIADRPDGTDVSVSHHHNPDAEAEMVCNEILLHMEDGKALGDFAILYRVNAYSRAFENVLAKAGIDYVIVASHGFFGRREVVDVMSYLEVANQFDMARTDADRVDALNRLINRPTRYLGKAFVQAVAVTARERDLNLVEAVERTERYNNRSLSYSQKRNAHELARQLREISKLTPVEAIRYIRSLDGVGYDAWMHRDDGTGDTEIERTENLNELQDVAAQFESLDTFVAYAKNQKDNGAEDGANGDRVKLMTIHRAKGLEWPVVFAVGVSQGLLPHSRAATDEEERRLAYVQFTRARDHLYVSSTSSWQRRSLGPSQFIMEAGLSVTPPEKLDG